MTTAVSGRGRPAWPGLGRGLAALVLALLFCIEAHAHATLTGTTPADGAVLAVPPETFVLSFNEPVSLIAATLVAPGGETLALDDFSSSASTVSVVLPADLGEGSHAMSWRAVSEDGHPISGTSFFVVGNASPISVAALPEQAAVTAFLLWPTRLVLFFALFFGVGGAGFRILAELPPPAAAIAQKASLSGLVAIPLALGLQGLDLLGGDLSQLGNHRAWWLGLTSAYGATLGLAGLALLLSLAALRLRHRIAGKSAAAIAILLAGLAISASGHASAANPQWLTRAALFVHITTIAWWVGALVPLILLMRRHDPVATSALMRFSRAIPFAIVPLIASGVILATVQLGPPGPSWWTPYGQVLAGKLSLLIVLFVIASWNRWVLTAPAAQGDIGAMRHMRRSITAEILIILVVLGLVSIWRFTPPPRALGAVAIPSLSLQMQQDDLVAMVTLSPDQVGEVDMAIVLRNAAGESVTPRAMRVSLEPQSGAIAPIVRGAQQASNGVWRIDGLNLPLAGLWLIEVEARISDFDLVKVNGTAEIGPP